MKAHTFEINAPSAFHELSEYLFRNKIAKDDSVIIRIPAKDPIEFNERVSFITNQPYAFCNFIKTCRAGVNGFPNDGTFQYPNGYTILNVAKQTSEYLTLNTQINISFERIGNEYQYELPTTGTIREAACRIDYFFISNSIVPGDSVVLKINDEKLSYVTQTLFYSLIGSALQVIGDIYKIPSMSLDLSDNYFDEADIEKSVLPIRLGQSGVNFTLTRS